MENIIGKEVLHKMDLNKDGIVTADET